MKFLSLQEQLFLDNLFAYKTVTKWKREDNIVKQGTKKSIIPIGVQYLQIKNINWTKTSRTKEKMLHIQLWKAPITNIETKGKKDEKRVYKNVSFDLIHCRQLVSKTVQYKLNEHCFDAIGRFYTEKQLNSLFKLKGVVFRGLVKHVEQVFNEHQFLKAEISKVYSRDEEINFNDIDYIKLYEKLKQ